MTRDGRRTYGRRRSDRFRLALGVALGLALAVVAGVQHGCDERGPSEPTPVAEAAPPQAAPTSSTGQAPAQKVGDQANPGYTVEFKKGGGFKIENKTTIHQGYQVYCTTFDDQDLPVSIQPASGQQHVVAPNGAWDGIIDEPYCRQCDATQFLTFFGKPGGLPLRGGSVFYDKDAVPFAANESNADKINACRCDSTVWVELEERETTYGEWGSCQVPQGTGQVQCAKTRAKTVTIYEKQNCTGAVRVKKVINLIDSTPCECPATCANTPASSSASQGFTLPNSSEATETAWVDANVQLGPFKLVDKDEFQHEDECTTVSINPGNSAKVALVKAGTTYRYHLNVVDGQTICSYDPPGSPKPKDISHVSYFVCK